MKLNIVPVILCGGSGARLWPESRENHPKQFIKLMDDSSLLQNTALRAQRVVGDVANSNLAGPVTVTTSSLADKAALHLSSVSLTESRQHILREPCARNTAAAIAYAALYVREVFGDQSLMWVLPSDHYVGNESALTQAVSKAVAVAKKGYLVTFGIHPHRAETGYGYIRTGKEIYNGAHIAKSFVEKPDKKTAQNFIDTGEYLWNSGMFLFSTRKILDAYETYAPETIKKVDESIKNTGNISDIAAHIYAQIPEQPFDKAIMENSRRDVAVIPCDPEWSDIGSWQSLWELREKDSNGNAVKGRAICYETSNCLIQTGSRLVACAGLEHIAVIDTPDALLVVDRRNGDAMRELIKTMKIQGHTEVEKKSNGTITGPREPHNFPVFNVASPTHNSLKAN